MPAFVSKVCVCVCVSALEAMQQGIKKFVKQALQLFTYLYNQELISAMK